MTIHARNIKKKNTITRGQILEYQRIFKDRLFAKLLNVFIRSFIHSSNKYL